MNVIYNVWLSNPKEKCPQSSEYKIFGSDSRDNFCEEGSEDRGISKKDLGSIELFYKHRRIDLRLSFLFLKSYPLIYYLALISTYFTANFINSIYVLIKLPYWATTTQG
jgi:hypothetical protein